MKKHYLRKEFYQDASVERINGVETSLIYKIKDGNILIAGYCTEEKVNIFPVIGQNLNPNHNFARNIERAQKYSDMIFDREYRIESKKFANNTQPPFSNYKADCRE